MLTSASPAAVRLRGSPNARAYGETDIDGRPLSDPTNASNVAKAAAVSFVAGRVAQHRPGAGEKVPAQSQVDRLRREAEAATDPIAKARLGEAATLAGLLRMVGHRPAQPASASVDHVLKSAADVYQPPGVPAPGTTFRPTGNVRLGVTLGLDDVPTCVPDSHSAGIPVEDGRNIGGLQNRTPLSILDLALGGRQEVIPDELDSRSGPGAQDTGTDSGVIAKAARISATERASIIKAATERAGERLRDDAALNRIRAHLARRSASTARR